MGLYDEVYGVVRCPHCGQKTRVTDQVKWTEDPYLVYYKIGDHIDAADGTYVEGSWVRDTMNSPCDKCGAKVYFTATVKNEILVSLDPYIRTEPEER